MSAIKVALCGTPLPSATTPAKAIGMSIRSATDLLDDFVRDGLVAELKYRAKRRLFALRDEVALRRRQLLGRAPGRSRLDRPAEEVLETTAGPAAALSPVARKANDYSDLETCTTHADAVIRQTRRNLDQLPPGMRKG